MESGIHSLLHENCHHQLIYAKFNLKVWYPPPNELDIWHYQHVNMDQIERAIEQFPWEKSFRNLRINEVWSVCLTKLSKKSSQITFPIKQ